MPDTDDELPEAYVRLLAAQRVVSKEEADEREKEVQREQQFTRMQRKLPRVY